MNQLLEKELMLEEPGYAGVDDMITVLSFIGWHDKNALWGGRTKEQTFEAACRLMQVKSDVAMSIVRPEDDKN